MADPNGERPEAQAVDDGERRCSLGALGCFCDATRETAWACAWCGKVHAVEPGGLSPMTGWCAGCQEQHRAANPTARFFVGYVAIEHTLPGGPHDGIWENSGFGFKREAQ